MIDINNYLNQLSENNYVIFLFHGVVDNSDYEIRNYTKKHLVSYEFEQLIAQLKEKGNPISMDDILYNFQNNINPPPFSFVITFDDGFANNYTIAAPILEHFEMPAIFYVSTDLIENNRMTWTDQIEFCLEKVAEGSIKLPWDGKELFFYDSKTKISIMEKLRNHLKANLQIDPSVIVDYLYDNFQMDLVTTGKGMLDKKMDWDQIKILNNNEYFIVAGHSHRHISLTSLSPEELDREIDISISLLSEKAGIESCHYAYPEGQKIDYSESVIACLKRKGIKCCPTAIHGINDSRKDLFHLNRILVD